MKALVKHAAGPGLQLDDVRMPEVGPDDALIRVKKTGICGTDLHIEAWDDWAQATIPAPMIVGHEFVGEVVEVGSNISEVVPGDLVSGEGHLNCGRCRNCMGGRRHLCPNTESLGVHRAGAFAEYVSLPMTNVWRHCEGVDEDVAAIFDPFGNAVHTALMFRVLGENVLVSGAGPIGCMATAVARHAGARNIVVIDPNPYRRQLVKAMGATVALEPSTDGMAEIREHLGIAEGFSVAFEMSGSSDALTSLLANMAHGGRIGLLGIPSQMVPLDLASVIFGMLTIRGIHGREIYETWYEMTDLIQSGLDIAPVITHRVPATEHGQAFALARSGKAGKVLLDWTVF